jgi:hypothetical protein
MLVASTGPFSGGIGTSGGRRRLGWRQTRRTGGGGLGVAGGGGWGGGGLRVAAGGGWGGGGVV